MNILLKVARFKVLVHFVTLGSSFNFKKISTNCTAYMYLMKTDVSFLMHLTLRI